MMNSVQYLFGLPLAACQTPLGAALALELAPDNALGAELKAVADEFVEIDSERGGDLRYEVAKYRIALWAGPSILRTQKEEILRKVRKTPSSLWSQVVQNVGQIPWAVSGGLFATPRFFFTSGFKPPFELNSLNVSDGLRLHFSILQNEGVVLVKILERMLVSLSSGQREEAEVEMGAFRTVAEHIAQQLETYKPHSSNDVVIHRHYSQKMLHWLAGLLRQMAKANGFVGTQLEGEDVGQSALHYRNAARALRREALLARELGDVARAEEGYWESAELFGKAFRMFRLLENEIEMIRSRIEQMTLLGILKRRREAAQNWRGALEIVERQTEVLAEDQEAMPWAGKRKDPLMQRYSAILKREKEILSQKE